MCEFCCPRSKSNQRRKRNLPVVFSRELRLFLLERPSICGQHLLRVDPHHSQEVPSSRLTQSRVQVFDLQGHIWQITPTCKQWKMSSSWFLLGPCAGSSGTRAKMRQHLPWYHRLHCWAIGRGVTITCSVIWNFFLLQSTTACNISWGLTWALKFFTFHSFLMSSPNLCLIKRLWWCG